MHHHTVLVTMKCGVGLLYLTQGLRVEGGDVSIAISHCQEVILPVHAQPCDGKLAREHHSNITTEQQTQKHISDDISIEIYYTVICHTVMDLSTVRNVS